MPILTLIDITGTQSYIFTSNRLQDCVAGSELVRRVTSQQMSGWLSDPVVPTGGEVIVSGSGTASLRFPNKEMARVFAAQLSRRVIDQAPGLELVVWHREYHDGELAGALQASQVQMEIAKLERQPNTRLLGLGVTAACHETRLPATDLELQDDERVPISSEVRARRQLRRESSKRLDRRWEAFIPQEAISFSRNGSPPKRLVFPYELDDLGRTRGERSLIGIVHLDGNGIGRAFSDWTKQQADDGSTDDRFIGDYQSLSRKLDQQFKGALEAVVHRVCQSVRWNSQKEYYLASALEGAEFPLHTLEHRDQQEQLALPVRPIVLAGDDLTFVCDGRIALDLAATALSAFGDSYFAEFDRHVYASAGVALVRSHTPFSRGYQLAEDLCNHAKKWLHDQGPDCNILDWHIGLPGTYDIENLRQRLYLEAGNRLTCRPYPMGPPEQPETWEWLSQRVLGSTETVSLRGPIWRQHRSKVKELAEVARGGRDAVERALSAWKIATPNLVLPVDDGYTDKGTPLLDASELLDIHWPLGQTSGEE